MKVCFEGHTEICYDEGYMDKNPCPLCEMIKERDNNVLLHDEVLAKKDEEIARLRGTMETLASR